MPFLEARGLPALSRSNVGVFPSVIRPSRNLIHGNGPVPLRWDPCSLASSFPHVNQHQRAVLPPFEFSSRSLTLPLEAQEPGPKRRLRVDPCGRGTLADLDQP